MQHTKITQKERELLSSWKKEGVANKEIARRLSRPVLTIRRELKRNKIRVSVGKDWELVYEPFHAQHVAEERKQNAYLAKQPLKDKKIYRYVLKHLRKGWSPEQISGRLREVDHKNDPSWQICMETIYQFIYKEKTDRTKQSQLSEMDGRRKRAKTLITVTDVSQPLYEYLRRKQVRRRKKGGRKSQRVRIPDRVSIHDRPVIVAKRKQFGHWEGDSIVGKNHASGLHTEYERVSSMIRFERLSRITAGETALAAQKIFSPLPEMARRSTTLDNGSEHTNHSDFGLQAYFADPYSSWQRGGNENCNLWIRYYFPKGTDFSTISDEELKDVEWELDNRPRKRLKFRTPQEVFSEYLNNP
ncbi:MAG TPA: IS30 family transposase [Patescibacteria group bacterium]|nr:IS30 family transposase [Patescibacteria group bacterium]